jgi:hypothetical protein
VQALVAARSFLIVRACNEEDAPVEELLSRGVLPTKPAAFTFRDAKITNALLEEWDGDVLGKNGAVLEEKCAGLWPLYVFVQLAMGGFIRIDGRPLFQDKAAWGNAMRVVFLILGQLYSLYSTKNGQPAACEEYVAQNFARLILHALVPPGETADRASFASTSLVLNLPPPCCLPLHPPPPKPLCVAALIICGVLIICISVFVYLCICVFVYLCIYVFVYLCICVLPYYCITVFVY